jgi:hypothetical protein
MMAIEGRCGKAAERTATDTACVMDVVVIPTIPVIQVIQVAISINQLSMNNEQEFVLPLLIVHLGTLRVLFIDTAPRHVVEGKSIVARLHEA